MRRLATVALVAALAAGGVAGCSSDTSKVSASSSSPASASSADLTKQVCVEATAASAKGRTEALAKLDEALKAMMAGDTSDAKIAQYQVEVKKIVGDWKTTLTELSAKPVKPELKAILDEATAFLVQISSDSDNTPTGTVKSKFGELEMKLAKVCA